MPKKEVFIPDLIENVRPALREITPNTFAGFNSHGLIVAGADTEREALDETAKRTKPIDDIRVVKVGRSG